MRAEGGIDRNFAAVTCVVVAVIVYWSLFPFQWIDRTGEVGALQAMLDSFYEKPHRLDLLANVLFYMPLGFFAVQAFRRRKLYVAITTAVGMALSVTMELTQYYDLGRVTAMSDVYANTAGTLLGATAGHLLHRQVAARLPERFRRRPFAILMLACWLGYRLFPYVPKIDLHAYWRAVRPLFRSPQVLPLALCTNLATWLALALLVQALVGVRWGRLGFFLFVPLVEGLRVLIGTPMTPAEVLGAAIALVLWTAGLERMRVWGFTLAALFTAMVILRGLTPFHFADTGRSFQWMPFRGFATGSLAVNMQSFLEKSFLYGTMVWLWVRAGSSIALATGGCAALVLSMSVAQVYLAGRSAELTDAAMLVVLALIMKATGEDKAPLAP